MDWLVIYSVQYPSELHIPLLVDLPVGLNFQDHPATLLPYEVDPKLARFNEEIQKEANIKSYIDNRRGPLTSAEGIILMSFLSNSDTKNPLIPDHSVYFLDVTSNFFNQTGLPAEQTANKAVFNCVTQLLHPQSRGSVSLQSADPYAPPDIDPNYFYDFRDINDMVQGMKVCQEIANSRAMKRIGTKPIEGFVVPGCEEFANDQDLYFRCIVRTYIITTNHQVGTARMGDLKDPTTVVDPKLRVKGIKGLRVVDASIMPTIPWSNTNIPTIMVAEKASDIIKSSIRCRRMSSEAITDPFKIKLDIKLKK